MHIVINHLQLDNIYELIPNNYIALARIVKRLILRVSTKLEK